MWYIIRHLPKTKLLLYIFPPFSYLAEAAPGETSNPSCCSNHQEGSRKKMVAGNACGKRTQLKIDLDVYDSKL